MVAAVAALGVAGGVTCRSAHDAHAVGDCDRHNAKRLQQEEDCKWLITVCLRIAEALFRVGGRDAQHWLGGAGHGQTGQDLRLVRERHRPTVHDGV